MPIPSPSEFQQILRKINTVIHRIAKSNHELFSAQLLDVIKQKNEMNKLGVYPLDNKYWQNLLMNLPKNIQLTQICDYFISNIKFNLMRQIKISCKKKSSPLLDDIARAIAVIETTKRGECQEMSFIAMHLLLQHALQKENIDLVQHNLHHICFAHKDYAETGLSHGFIIIGEIKELSFFGSLSYEKLLSFADNFIIWDPFKNIAYTIKELKEQPEDSDFKKYLQSLELDQHGIDSTVTTFTTKNLKSLENGISEYKSLAIEYKKLEQSANIELIEYVQNIYIILDSLKEKPELSVYRSTINQLQANFIDTFEALTKLPRPVLTADPRTQDTKLIENKFELEAATVELRTWLLNNPGKIMDPMKCLQIIGKDVKLLEFKTPDKVYNLLKSNYYYAIGSLMYRGGAFKEALSLTTRCKMLREQWIDTPEHIDAAKSKIILIETELAKQEKIAKPAPVGS